MRKCSIVAVALLLAVPAFGQPTEEVGAGAGVVAPPHTGPIPPPEATLALLYDNGPLVSNPGGGSGGADLSQLENITLGMTTLGAANQGPASTGNRMADEFTVTDSAGWHIDEIVTYNYQTSAGTTSTTTAVNLQIWDGPPNDAGSTVVWGDLTTDLLATTSWTGIYRAAESTPTDGNRAIYENRATINADLAAGTYWIDFAPTGSAAFSGPWAPPVTIPGQTSTGNAMQYFGGAWQAFNDGGTGTALGVPFLVEGTNLARPIIEVPTVSGVGLVLLALLLVSLSVVLLRRRRQAS